MGNISDNSSDSSTAMDSLETKLPGSPISSDVQSLPIKSKAEENSMLGMSPSTLAIEWFDASESMSSPTSVAVVLAVKVVEETGEMFGTREERLEFGGEDLEDTPKKASFEPTAFPELTSRSPTSRFANSKNSPKSSLISRLDHYFSKKSPAKTEGREGEELEENMNQGVNEREENDEETEYVIEGQKTGSSLQLAPPPNNPDHLLQSNTHFPSLSPSYAPSTESASTPSNLVDSEMKRQKKKAKKKARQLNKEQQMKRQRMQRAEFLKNQEEKLAEQKRHLAEYAASVAKPTVSKTDEESSQQQEQEEKEENNMQNVSVVNIEEHQKGGEDTSTSATSPLPASFDSPSPPSSIASPDSLSSNSSYMPRKEDSTRRFGPSRSRDITPPRSSTPRIRKDTPIKTEIVQMVVRVPKNNEGIEDVKVEPDWSLPKNSDLKVVINSQDIEPEVVQVETLETFEVMVCGQRRQVTPFTPRSKQNSSSNNEETGQKQAESSSSNSVFDIPEHPPVVVPFRDAPIIMTSSNQQLPQIQSQPRFVAMPMTFNPQQGPPVMMGAPIISSYGPVQSRFVPMQPNFGLPPPPPQFPPVGVVPVTMRRIPMQRMSALPVMMNRPIYLPQPPQGPPRMQMQPIQVPHPPAPHHPIQQHPPMQAMQLPQPSHIVRVQTQQHPPQQQQQVFPGQRPLVRPTRTPLSITAPPPQSSIKTEKNSKSDSKNKSMAEKIKEKDKKLENEKNKDKKEEATTPTVEKPVAIEQSEVVEQPLVVESSLDVEPSAAVEQQAVVEQSAAVEQQAVVEKSVADKKPVDESESEKPERIEIRRSSSLELNGELITAGVATILDESDDEQPPFQSTSNVHPPLSPTSEAQQEAINRVLGFSKECEGTSFDIWAGWMNEMPPHPESLGFNKNFAKMLEEDEKAVMTGKNRKLVQEKLDEEVTKPTLMSICKKMEPFFVNSRAFWINSRATVDGQKLRDMFNEAYKGSIPQEDRRILEKVWSFQPGYFHVFDVLIGSVLELSYNYSSTSDDKNDKNSDGLYTLYQSLPPVDGVEKFFKRFEESIIPQLLKYISNRFVTVRAFVSIVEVVKENELTVSDLYYMATLVFGARQFYSKFNARIKQLHIIETGGKRWIRQTSMDEDHPKSSFPSYENRMTGVPDFLTRLRPHIDDVLQLLPDAVVNDDEFFKAAKLVCGWSGDHEQCIWQTIIKDRSLFQEFYEAYRPFLRIEIRMGTIYLRKLTYDDDDEVTDEGKSLDLVADSHDISLISSIKSDECRNEKKKEVSYATDTDLIVPDCPPPPSGYSSSSAQTDNIDTEDIRDLERQVIRKLKRGNVTFAEFIKCDNAREMHQFLIDTFKKMDLRYFAFILEKTLTETREQSWKETVELREAAEEARLLLELSREEHKKEFGELRNRMETISRFETYEVQVASNSRIEVLKERINQLTQDREVLLREEVKEERASMQKQMKLLKEKHLQEKRLLSEEIARLKCENARLSAGQKELADLRREQVEMSARCENEMNKAKKMYQDSSKLLRDSQLMFLSEENQSSSMPSNRASILKTPDSENEVSRERVTPPTTLSPVQQSTEARRQLRKMEKYAAEFDADELRDFARDLLEWYTNTKANHKERKTAEKQLKEYELALDCIENAIQENLEMLKLNVIEGLRVVPDVPMPFSETVMKKMFEYTESVIEEKREQIIEEEDGCLICTELIEEHCETVTCDTCYKEYHYHCISQWLKINSICPACARALKDPNEYPMLE